MASRKKCATIREVARKAGMSVSTASAILNNRNGFADETRKRVWDAAHLLDYRPNSEARLLRQGDVPEPRNRTRLLMHISRQGDRPLESDSFEAHRTQLLEAAVLRRNYFLTHYWYQEVKGFLCPLVLDRLIDGVLLGCPHEEIIATLRDKIPTVLLDVNIPSDKTGLPVVNMDLEDGWMRLLKQASEAGHKRAFLIKTPDYTDMFSRGLGNAISVAGLRISPQDKLFVPVTSATHYELLWPVAEQIRHAIRDRRISLIIAPNLFTASTLRNMLAAAGIRFPEDASIVSVNFQSWAEPEIASVNYDWRSLAENALTILLQWLDTGNVQCKEYLVRAEISSGIMFRSVREKCSNPPDSFSNS